MYSVGQHIDGANLLGASIKLNGNMADVVLLDAAQRADTHNAFGSAVYLNLVVNVQRIIFILRNILAGLIIDIYFVDVTGSVREKGCIAEPFIRLKCISNLVWKMLCFVCPATVT